MGKGGENSNPVRGTTKPATSAGFTIKKVKRTRFRTYFKTKQKQSMAATPYKPAKLNDNNPKDWFVYYSYMSPTTGKFERFRERYGLNNQNKLEHLAASYKSTVEQVRLTMAQEIIGVINDELKKGFNPFTQLSYKNVGGSSTVVEVLERLVENLNASASKNTQETYNLMLSRFKKYLNEKKFAEYTVQHFNVDHAKAFQKYLQDKLQLEKKTINATLSHIGLFWDELIEMKYVKENPFRIKAIRKTSHGHQRKDDVYEPLTPAEIEAMVAAFKKKKNLGMVRFMGFVYYAWIRPVEVSRIRIADVDIKNKLIRLKSSATKNEKGAYVQIVPELMKLIEPLHIERIQQQDWFLFSKNLQPGKEQIKDVWRSVTERYWNPTAKKLHIKKALYALKHTGNIEYLLNNKGKSDLKWQQMQNRHSSAAQTEQYNRKLGAYFIDLEGVKFRSF
jgi:integrase